MEPSSLGCSQPHCGPLPSDASGYLEVKCGSEGVWGSGEVRVPGGTLLLGGKIQTCAVCMHQCAGALQHGLRVGLEMQSCAHVQSCPHLYMTPTAQRPWGGELGHTPMVRWAVLHCPL